MDPKELLRKARAALADGHSLREVNEAVAIESGGEFSSVAALAQAVENPEDQAIIERAERVGSGLGSGVENFLRVLGQGASYGMLDELLAVGPKGLLRMGLGDRVGGAMEAATPEGQARMETQRQRMEDLREMHPVTTAATEMGGGLIGPSAGVGALRAIGSPLVRGAAVGMGSGAVGGGLYGLGEAEGDLEERLPSALRSGGVGAAVGLPLGLLGAAAGPLASRLFGRQAKQRGVRLASEIERTSGLSPSVQRFSDEVEREFDRIRRQMYKPLERQYQVVDNPIVLEALKHPDILPSVRRVSREVAEGKRAPSFEELQAIRQQLRGLQDKAYGTGRKPADPNNVKRYGEALGSLDEVMEDAIPGYAEAQAAYRRVVEIRGAFETGKRMMRPSIRAEEVQMTLNELSTPEAQEALRRGMFSYLERALRTREGPSTGVIKAILEAGPEMEGKLQKIFPDQVSFDEFMRVVKVEKNYDKARRLMVQAFRISLFAAGAGGAGAGLLSLIQ